MSRNRDSVRELRGTETFPSELLPSLPGAALICPEKKNLRSPPSTGGHNEGIEIQVPDELRDQDPGLEMLCTSITQHSIRVPGTATGTEGVT